MKNLLFCLLLTSLIVGCASPSEPQADQLAEAVEKLNLAFEKQDGSAYFELLPQSVVSEFKAEGCELWNTGCTNTCNEEMQECISSCEEDKTEKNCNEYCLKAAELEPFKNCDEVCGASCDEFVKNSAKILWYQKITTQGMTVHVTIINSTVEGNNARVWIKGKTTMNGKEMSENGELPFIKENEQWKLAQDILGILNWR